MATVPPGGVPVAAAEPAPVPGECAREAGAERCLYRSGFPSAGLVSVCAPGAECRVGYYYGQVDDAVWLAPPAGRASLPRPEVTWLTSTLAHVRFACGPSCSFSYFFDARRRRLSPPRDNVLAVDTGRQLLVGAEARTLVARQVFSGRPVLRIERDWAPGPAAAAVTRARFDPDGRLTLAWIGAAKGDPVTERITVPSVPLPP